MKAAIPRLEAPELPMDNEGQRAPGKVQFPKWWQWVAGHEELQVPGREPPSGPRAMRANRS